MALKEISKIIPTESQVILQINSEFNEKFKQYEKQVHKIIQYMFHKKIESLLEHEELADRIIRKLKRESTIPFDFDELQDFGTISISVMS